MHQLDDEFQIENTNAKNQYLLFLVGGVLYGIEALKAQEIVEYTSLTKVPMINSCVKGVMNIRGNIVSVVDLLERFSLGSTTIGDKTSIIVVRVKDGEEEVEIGLLIDEVYEVDNIEKSNLTKAPEFGSQIDAKFILCMGKYDKKYIAILDVETILNIDELSKLAQ